MLFVPRQEVGCGWVAETQFRKKQAMHGTNRDGHELSLFTCDLQMRHQRRTRSKSQGVKHPDSHSGNPGNPQTTAEQSQVAMRAAVPPQSQRAPSGPPLQ